MVGYLLLLFIVWRVMQGRHLTREAIRHVVPRVPEWTQGTLLTFIIRRNKTDKYLVLSLLREMPFHYRSQLIAVIESTRSAEHASMALNLVPGLTTSERSRLIGVLETAEDKRWASWTLVVIVNLTTSERSRLEAVSGT